MTTRVSGAVRVARRRAAAAGMLVSGAALAALSAYVVLGFTAGCGTGTTATHVGSCTGNSAVVAVFSFPGAVICLVLATALLRGASWARWPAVGFGAVLATVLAAGAVAGVVALAGDGTDVAGGIAVGVSGLALAVLCALPPILLSSARGAEAFPE